MTPVSEVPFPTRYAIIVSYSIYSHWNVVNSKYWSNECVHVLKCIIYWMEMTTFPCFSIMHSLNNIHQINPLIILSSGPNPGKRRTNLHLELADWRRKLSTRRTKSNSLVLRMNTVSETFTIMKWWFLIWPFRLQMSWCDLSSRWSRLSMQSGPRVMELVQPTWHKRSLLQRPRKYWRNHKVRIFANHKKIYSKVFSISENKVAGQTTDYVNRMIAKYNWIIR